VSENDVVMALAAHWKDVLSHLHADDLPLLADLVGRITSADTDEESARAAFADLLPLLEARLPPGHPVRRAISGTRFIGVSSVSLADQFAELSQMLDLALEPDALQADQGIGASEPDPQDWLLAEPSLTEEQVRDIGSEPDERGLIRLPHASSTRVLPAFQFGSDGRPFAVVVTINLILDAASDPWGVADWWLGENAWLHGVPADLIGEVEDSDLILAARAELPGE
jgi:hypothetical protein